MSETWHWRSRKLLGTYVAYIVLTNAYWFWLTLPDLYTAKNDNWGKIFDKILNRRLIILVLFLCITLLHAEEWSVRMVTVGQQHITWMQHSLCLWLASTVGDRAFPVIGSRFWDTLSDSVTSAPSLSVFRSRLKSHLFERSFPADCYWHLPPVLTQDSRTVV